MAQLINEIIPFIALWSFILSTILGVIKINERRRKIIVKTKSEYYFNDQLDISDPSYFENRLTIQCMNNGKRPLEIVGCGFLIDDKHKIFYNYPSEESKNLPKTINDGQNIIIPIDIGNLLNGLIKSKHINTKKIKGFFKDGRDKEYYSKNIKFNARDQLNFFPKLKEKFIKSVGNHETSAE